MLDVLIFIAAAGSVIAGAWDLLTTEVPDEVPALMISLGIFVHFVNAGTSGDFYPLMLSLIIGTILLAAGLLVYRKGQWGGADAWILAAIGYLIPLYNGNIFIVDYLLNFLIVSAAYMVAYAIIIGAKTHGIFSHFIDEVKARQRIVIGVPLAYAVFIVAIVAALGAYSYNLMPLVYTLLLVIFLTLFWAYGRAVEKYAFRKKIPTSKLKEGDVLEDMVWRGLTAEEVRNIRKNKKFVVIKEGVRFVPTFAIALAVTLLYGNILFALLF